MNPFSHIDWIFFDVGETLVNEKNSYDHFFQKSCNKLSQYEISISPDEYRKKVEYCYKHNISRPLNTVWTSFGIPSEKPKWCHHKEALYPNTLNCLKILAKNYKLGIIANQSIHLKERILDMNINQYFNIIISSADVLIKKPDPKIFELALTEANSSASRSIYVGDRIDNDIIPANKLGFTTIRIKQGMGKYQQEDSVYPSNYTVNDIKELLTLLNL